jgi:hypothetical protein
MIDSHPLTPLFTPRSVAVIGAKEDNDCRWIRLSAFPDGPVAVP